MGRRLAKVCHDALAIMQTSRTVSDLCWWKRTVPAVRSMGAVRGASTAGAATNTPSFPPLSVRYSRA